MPTATGTIDLEFSDETYDDRDGTQLARRSLRKVFKGDLEGASEGEFLLAIAPAGSAAYVGLDRVTASIDGRSGSFVLVHAATQSADKAVASIGVLTNSATEGLEGLRGELTIVIAPDRSHSYSFDYELEES
jgi:hypothetical protein